jgi:hypothetical protein
MAQYWLQTPIENAKEVVKRFIIDNPTLTALQGLDINYTINTEVIFYNLHTGGAPTFNNMTIYFGSFIFGDSTGAMKVTINDGSNTVTTMDTSTGTGNVLNGLYPYVIWNKMVSNPSSLCYFVGYKFTLS